MTIPTFQYGQELDAGGNITFPGSYGIQSTADESIPIMIGNFRALKDGNIATPAPHSHDNSSVTSIDWSKILNKPNFAAPSFKGVVATPAAIPTTNNALNDTYIVAASDGSAGGIYVCVATSGTFAQQFQKISGGASLVNPVFTGTPKIGNNDIATVDQIPTTPDKVGAAPAGFGLGTEATNISLNDLNNLVENMQTGWYTGSFITNAPSTGNWYITHIGSKWSNGDSCVQYATAFGENSSVYSSGTTFIRICYANKWTPWKQIATTDQAIFGCQTGIPMQVKNNQIQLSADDHGIYFNWIDATGNYRSITLTAPAANVTRII
jgi:hypothetical protein